VNLKTRSIRVHFTKCFYVAALLTFASGCEPNEEDAGDEGTDDTLDIAGEYTDEFADTHTIDETTWTNSAGVFHVEQWDDEAMFLVAQNDDANQFSPGLWSRFDWTWSGDELYYCQSVFDGADLDAALGGSANRDELMTGCGGFAWTNLTP
jgi:hypothetical protein